MAAGAGTLNVVVSDSHRRAVGESMTAGGDIDGDGTLDLLVADNSADSSGAVRRLLGDGIALVVGAGVGSGGQFGESIALVRHPSPTIGLLGDVDTDGVPDLFVGAFQDGVGSNDGAAFFFYVARPVIAQTRAAASLIITEDLDIGERVAEFIGDVNGDGFSDLAVGEPGASSGAGRLQILY